MGLNNACHNADENEGTDVQGSATSLSEPIKAQLSWFAVGGFCGIWAVERKIGALEFALIAIIATSIGSLFVWVGARLLKKGHIQEERRST
ncbi:MAG: hypothetical protein DRQ02_10115 [Candidatus Latescibacterota bacterium]|nr:MAG: hypothetical protein DRQ02_10115 [Candidatus Latescibacterota bacterium]